MSLFQIHIVSEPAEIPEAPEIEAMMFTITEEEIVEVEAATARQAARHAIRHAIRHGIISAGGRLVRYFEMNGEELFNH